MSDDDVLCVWMVTAGLEPATTAERFTRTMRVTYQEWAGGDVPGQRLRDARREEAVGYASRLMADESFSWVRMEYRSSDSPWADGRGTESGA